MIVRWETRLHLLDDPIPLESEVLVQIIERALLPKIWYEEKSRFQFSHPLAKVGFFLRNEGPALTIGKIHASRIQQKIARSRVLAFVYGTHEGQPVVAVGPLCSVDIDMTCFPTAWVASIPKGRDASWCFQAAWAFLIDKPEMLSAIYNYSPYSGLEPEFSFEVAIASGVLVSSSPAPEFLEVKLANAVGKEKADPPLEGSLFLAGAGAYAHAYILPFLSKINRHTVIDINPILAVTTAEMFGFRHADTCCERGFLKLKEVKSPVLVIATYHSTHVELAKLAYTINPNTKIFIEKPPVTSRRQLKTLLDLRRQGAWIEIGYNRRHIPFIQKARVLLEQESGPTHIVCLVKELKIPKEHWYYWPSQGTRITGNLCHWLDLGIFLIGSEPVRMEAQSALGSLPGDEVSATVYFEDGSKLSLVATDRGNSLRGVQEYIEIRRGDLTIVIEDFRLMRVLSGGRAKTLWAFFRDKGHKRMYLQLLKDISDDGSPRYPSEDLRRSSKLYLDIRDAVMKAISGSESSEDKLTMT